MGELIVTWHDVVRLGLFAAHILMLMLTVKLAVGNGRWRHPFRDANLWLALALALFLSGSIRQRAENIGTGPFPNPVQTSFTVLGTICVIIWLVDRVEFKPIVRRQEAFAERRAERRRKRVERRRAEERGEVVHRHHQG